MAEAITEMKLPGSYIEVRAEGLIGVGAISTGNVGIVGTAARGPVDSPLAIGSYSDALDLFGAYDPFEDPTEEDAPLTLVRALEQCFAGGARNVFAVRAANGTPTAATLDVRAAGDTEAFTLTALDPGTWGRETSVTITSDTVDANTTFRLVIAYRNQREVYEGANVGDIHDELGTSRLVTVGDVDNAASALDLVDTHLDGGTDGAAVTTVDLARALAALEDQTVNIVLVAGGVASVHANILSAHVERTENDGRERIAFVGATSSGTATAAPDIIDDAAATSDDRVVICAPGMVATDAPSGSNVVLPPAYTAGVVAGKLATLAPHVSLTNKAVPLTPDVQYSTALTGTLLDNRILVVRRKFGAQVVKGITSAPDPFDQISIRRIVDYAKAGVRSGADPYIGRLNNVRVRAALKATLDGFLSQMVLDEMLVDYRLEVTATRAQEINGIAAVVMTLRPTFSIDYIRVTMNLE